MRVYFCTSSGRSNPESGPGSADDEVQFHPFQCLAPERCAISLIRAPCNSCYQVNVMVRDIPRVLVVDDDAPTCELLELAFTDEGWDVQVRTRGQDALDLLRRW